ncbi:PepSY-associated TM helix domain-containing protein [Flexithrix dorotheae]|uniref:PepSY-associated TM helix domain-containing protein n=1 Tax=Flexithrix dorotheae TaxID=70993 RepID=UPI00036160C4|nr:PepSY-associated TM helix domain-containing protein [Flexithrix dorotheae]
MSKPLKKLILNLHLWIGLITGIVLFIEGVTGAIYVFAIEISEKIYEDRYTITNIPKNATPLPLSQLKETAIGALKEDAPILRIYQPNDPKATVSFVFQKTKHDALTYAGYMEVCKTVFVNPYTAEIVKIENTKWEFFNVIMWMHMTLLLGYEWGSQIVAWSVVGFLILLISGLVLWWPKNKKSRGMRFWFKWKPGFGFKRKNFDLHAILGFYIISLSIIIAVTGLFWSFTSLNQGIQWIANGGKTVTRPLPEPPTEKESDDLNPLDNMHQIIRSQLNNAHAYVIKMPRRPEFPYVVRLYLSNRVFYDRIVYYFDSGSGSLLRKDEVSDLSGGEQVSGINYDIHVGSIGGLPTKILAFFTCLIIASLPITGFIIWRNKSYRT